VPALNWHPGRTHASIGASLAPVLPGIGGSHAFQMQVKTDPLGLPIAVVGDLLRMKAVTPAGAVLDNWLLITGRDTSVTGYTTYTVLKQSGTAGLFPAGTAVVNYGQSGQGFLFLTSDDADGPFYSVRTHAGAPWSVQTEVGRFGNLKNSFGVGAVNRYGFAAGDYAGGNYVLYNPTSGFILKAGSGDVQVDSGGIKIGGTGTRFQMYDTNAFGNVVGQLFTTLTGSGAWTALRNSGFGATFVDGKSIMSSATAAGHQMNFILHAFDAGLHGYGVMYATLAAQMDGFTVGANAAPNTMLDVRGSGTFTGGLNVGTATGAGTGVIKASSTIQTVMTDGSMNFFDDTGSAQVYLNVRPSALKGGVVMWTEDTVADRWQLGIKPSDTNLYWMTGVISAPTTRMTLSNAGVLNLTGALQRGGTQVVSTRVTGYGAMTTTAANRATVYDPATITLPQLAARVRALQDDLTTHGLIGP
jgi:hypothetical protein